ncbi:PQ-loop repeat-containing protein [Ascoidea rubescens DSM 1968]|uniref:PQ-loop-domain-containing protein n=1 Tax=Ascoidea rubescens DSM 1968 TaxID=1344418 RepID=A0A1D2VFB4_9ASCO|nr:PQ-loop-domain-containing protein [Ascoidea rubescens DSM 1968]ODV60315.1 PQ-loop-domain-containing protein [Ascoidea rubescens DSM 1968]
MFDLFLNQAEPSQLRVILSGISGSTSLACWFVLLVPQLIEQWRLKSAEGISIGFLFIWFTGDIANLLGSVLAKLLPQVILLAVWFCFSDGLIIFSYYYYTYIYPNQLKKLIKRHEEQQKKSVQLSITNSHGETSPLIIQPTEERLQQNRRRSRRSRVSRKSVSSLNRESLAYWANMKGKLNVFVKYILPILFVICAGAVGYLISAKSSDNEPNNGGGDNNDNDEIAVLPQLLGYLSATCYLSARLPQIYQNYKRKSVHGLSLLFFIFSTFGNVTYALQILFFRSDWKYILLNLSWLMGSLGTIFEDTIIFIQFFIYNRNSSEEDEEAEQFPAHQTSGLGVAV